MAERSQRHTRSNCPIAINGVESIAVFSATLEPATSKTKKRIGLLLVKV